MKWIHKPANPQQVEALARSLRANSSLGLNSEVLAAPLARLLITRQITEDESAQRFLLPSISDLHSPYAMAGMKAAVERLAQAIARREGILIYGDYDVDGTTAIVVLKTAIEICGGKADFYVPHRIREGNGMKEDVIERAASEGVRLIISVDTGIRAMAAAETAFRLGIDLIVTDHHLPGRDGVPRSLAVLNPNQPGCNYPCKLLCGCAVAFKLAQALIENSLHRPDQSRLLMSFMKVVAIATIADAVPLIGENRVFAKLGLEALATPVNAGLKALLDVAEISRSRPLTSADVAFRLAPRLNAAGRMDIAHDVIELFSQKDPVRAGEIAARLNQLNSQRQDEERHILEKVEARLAEEPALGEAFCIVVDGEEWHRGVIGLTATRVVERFRRPTLIISRDGEQAHGSGRSIRCFHLLDALESCAELFDRYGGHAHAVGFRLPSERIVELRSRLDSYTRARLSPTDFEPVLEIDGEIALDQVTPEFLSAVSRLAPFGMGNPEPVFAAYAVRLLQPPRVVKEKHLKFKLAAASNPGDVAGNPRWRRAITYEAMAWRMAERTRPEQLLPGDRLDVAFTIGHNDHPHLGGLELVLSDFLSVSSKISAAASVDR